MAASHPHVTVLAQAVCDALAPTLPARGSPPRGVLVDATCGMGGHTAALLARLAPLRAFAFDADGAALALARARLRDLGTPVAFVHAPFSRVAPTMVDAGITEVAAMVADLGVSSLQFDTPERGFSLRYDGPLDMRMNPAAGTSAAELLGTIEVGALVRILREFGEEPDAPRIARAIVAARPETTLALARTVESAMSAPARRKLGLRIHPATRTFMALRICVNDELGELDRLLAEGPFLLGVGGRMAIITFHSLEDRRVKRRFRELSRPPSLPPHLPVRADDLPRPGFAVPRNYGHGVVPTPQEVRSNPRARSARLRVLERIEASPA